MNRSDKEGPRVANGSSGTGTGIVNSMDQMLKLPLQVTGATWDFMMQGMRNMTGTGHQERTAEPNALIASDDLGGDDLKYITWSLIFTKPGFECVLEPQTSELVNYSADVPSFAAVKIAKFLEKARHGHVEKAESWRDREYPHEYSRTETASSANDRGWRIPVDDQKYIMFLHRVEWRLKKQEEVARVERVTIERGTARIA
jgi:hypothetical protein